MEQYELLQHTVEVLDRLGIPYLVTRSMVTIFFGEPRVTNDRDIVVDLPAQQIKPFCDAFQSPEFDLSHEAVREAVNTSGQFNIIHPASGLKVDVIIPRDTPFNRSRLDRAIRVDPGGGRRASFASIEDVIIKKMEYYHERGSAKHLRDITGVLKVSGDRIDRGYIDDWAKRLQLVDIWEAILDRMGGSSSRYTGGAAMVDSKSRNDLA
ncbi:MAG: hypothetical protein ACE5EC_08915 [Phycisphaerae bacterium]